MSGQSARKIPKNPEAPSARTGNRAIYLHVGVLSASVIALYAQALRYGFVADDRGEVLQDRLIRSLANLPKLFVHSVWFFSGARSDNYYRPLKLAAYSIEYRLFDFHPGWWHFVNMVIYLATAIVIYFLMRDLAWREHAVDRANESRGRAVHSESGSPVGQHPGYREAATAVAFWAALFFVFHPVHVEAVAWIAAGNDLLCGILLLLSLWLYHRGRLPRQEGSPGTPLRGPTLGSGSLYTASVLLFFAGLLFKETALTFPAVILAYDYFYRQEPIRGLLCGWRRYLGYFGALGVYLAMRVHALHGFAPAANPLHATGRDVVLSVPVLVTRYVGKLLVPINLNFWYDYGPVRAFGWQPVAAGVLVLLLLAAMFWLRGTREGTGFGRRQPLPLLSFALAWFWLTLVPVLDAAKLSANVFTDRYLYLPSFAFCLFAAQGWLWVRQHLLQPKAPGGRLTRALAYAGLAALFFFYSFVVVRRLPDWRDDFRLVTKTLRQSPESPYVVGWLGSLYFQRGQYQDALDSFHRAVAIDPNLAFVHSNLGSAYLALGRREEALRETLQATRIEPTFAEAWTNLCSLYNVEQQWTQGLEACGRALALQPDDYTTLAQFGLALWNNGQRDRALAQERRAVALEPDRLDARFYLAVCLADVGQLDAAAHQLEHGLRAEPGSGIAYLARYELGVIYQIKGRWQEAAEQYQQALALNPNYIPARTQLDAARAHLANPPRAP